MIIMKNLFIEFISLFNFTRVDFTVAMETRGSNLHSYLDLGADVKYFGVQTYSKKKHSERVLRALLKLESWADHGADLRYC